MPILVNNLNWMFLNSFLAFLPIVFASLAFKFSKKIYWFLFFILWLIFFPNTIYLLTDIQYLPGQISSLNLYYDLLLLVEYFFLILFGIFSYLYSLKVILEIIKKKFRKLKEKHINEIVFIFNFIVSFGVALGKIQRTESWDILLNPQRVILDITRSINSPEILLFIVIFGMVINLIYLGRLYFL